MPQILPLESLFYGIFGLQKGIYLLSGLDPSEQNFNCRRSKQCLKLIKFTISLYSCAPISELPSNIRTRLQISKC